MHAPRIIGLVGVVVLALGVFMATSLIWVVLEPGMPALQPWLISISVTIGVGTACFLYGREAKETARKSHRAVRARGDELTRREALVVVIASWLACSVFGALPMLLDGMTTHPVDALFEATSGFTTTGSSVLTDIESNTRAALWWRSMIQWLGGMGIVVLFIAVFPQVGGSSRKLFEAEAPGPEKDQLHLRIRQTGLLLWKIYTGLTAVLTGLLMALGMSFFDAICHAFATIATGGFSTRNESVGAFDSASIDATITLFMLLAGINFSLYIRLSRGDRRFFRTDRELRVYGAMFLLATAVVTLSILERHSGNLLEALRYGSFQVAAILSSTGYSTDDYDAYPYLARGLLVAGMFVGGMGGSTAGGFKISRAMIVAKAAFQEIRHAVQPRAIFATRIGDRQIPDTVVRSAMALFVISLALLVISTVILHGLGMDSESAFGAATTCLFNMGPGLGTVGPTQNFSGVPDAGKLLLCALMILGRLEFYTVLALLLPGFWKPGGKV
ncbi:MAG: TrkH family potassium uptake protein [Proteobacteria bacterium]|nr:TrkH family potassium uptake protein [Pseudomonadota bacterium]